MLEAIKRNLRKDGSVEIPEKAYNEIERTLLNNYLLGFLTGFKQIEDKVSHKVKLQFAEYGGVEPEAAISFLRSRVPLTKAEFERLEEIFRARAFTVARVTSIDLIRAVQEELAKAIKDGKTLREFIENIDDLFARRGYAPLSPHHLETVYRTNLQNAYQAGRWAAIEKHRDIVKYLEYHAILDERVRPSHAAMHGYVAPIDDAIWRKWYPPNGFNCRCTVVVITEYEARIRGIRPSRARIDLEPDEGFANHPFFGGLPPELIRRARQYGIEIPEAAIRSLSGVFRPTNREELVNKVISIWEEFSQRYETGDLREIRWDARLPRGIHGQYIPAVGRIEINKSRSGLIEQALRRLNSGRTLTKRQMNALRTLWHEINHAIGDQEFYLYRQRIFWRTLIEVVNESMARLTLGDFVEKLGFDRNLINLDKVLNESDGYIVETRNFIRLFEAFGVDREEFREFITNLNWAVKQREYMNEIVRFLQVHADVSEYLIWDIMEELGQDFEEKLRSLKRLLESMGIRSGKIL